jgi:hypothetical protein
MPEVEEPPSQQEINDGDGDTSTSQGDIENATQAVEDVRDRGATAGYSAEWKAEYDKASEARNAKVSKFFNDMFKEFAPDAGFEDIPESMSPEDVYNEESARGDYVRKYYENAGGELKTALEKAGIDFDKLKAKDPQETKKLGDWLKKAGDWITDKRLLMALAVVGGIITSIEVLKHIADEETGCYQDGTSAGTSVGPISAISEANCVCSVYNWNKYSIGDVLGQIPGAVAHAAGDAGDDFLKGLFGKFAKYILLILGGILLLGLAFWIYGKTKTDPMTKMMNEQMKMEQMSQMEAMKARAPPPSTSSEDASQLSFMLF